MLATLANPGARTGRPERPAAAQGAAPQIARAQRTQNLVVHSGKPQTLSIGRIPWLPHSPKRQRGDGWASKPVPALTLGAMWKSSRRAVKTMDSSTRPHRESSGFRRPQRQTAGHGSEFVARPHPVRPKPRFKDSADRGYEG